MIDNRYPGDLKPLRWAGVAGNTPFQRWKRETFRGGISDPFVISGDVHHASGERRTQYLHAIDVVPTVLDAIGIDPPAQVRGIAQNPVHGLSFAGTFADPAAESARRTQYYEMFATRSIYHDGWQAVCPWPMEKPLTVEALQELDPAGWELYHVDDDFSEARNLASEYPEKVEEMVSRWWTEAASTTCYSSIRLRRAVDPRASISSPAYVYLPGSGEGPVRGPP